MYKTVKEEKTKDEDENSLSLGTSDAWELTLDRPKSISFKVVHSADSMKFNDLMSLCNTLGTLECRTLILTAAWYANLWIACVSITVSPPPTNFLRSSWSFVMNDVQWGGWIYLSRQTHEISYSECSASNRLPPSMNSITIHSSFCCQMHAP